MNLLFVHSVSSRAQAIEIVNLLGKVPYFHGIESFVVQECRMLTGNGLTHSKNNRRNYYQINLDSDVWLKAEQVMHSAQAVARAHCWVLGYLAGKRRSKSKSRVTFITQDTRDPAEIAGDRVAAKVRSGKCKIGETGDIIPSYTELSL